jgi:hypothetical protein
MAWLTNMTRLVSFPHVSDIVGGYLVFAPCGGPDGTVGDRAEREAKISPRCVTAGEGPEQLPEGMAFGFDKGLD